MTTYLTSNILQECSKLAQQLGRVYGANRRAAHPAHVHLCALRSDSRLRNLCRQKNAGFEKYLVR